MPIKSLVDSYEFGSGLPEIARIRKGAAKTEKNRPGKDLETYFRVTMSPGFEMHQSTFQLLYGENPQYFAPVRFGGSTVDDVFDFWNRGYTATKLMHKCDGETQVRHFDVEKGVYSSEPKACESASGCGCKNTGKIKLFLPKLIEETGIFGYVLLTTTSLYDIRNLLNCFKDMEHFAAMRGQDLSSIDWLIGRAPRIISVPVPKPKPEDAEKYRRAHNGQDWRPGDRMNTSKGLLYIRPTKDFTKQVLLAAVNTITLLPEPKREPLPMAVGGEITAVNKIVHMDQSQSKPQRRIGDKPAAGVPDPTPASTHIHDDHDDEEDEDSAPEFLPEFLKWVKTTFGNMREIQINAALELAPDWESDIIEAKAAIITYAMDYDPKLTGEYTGGRGYPIEVQDAAEGIINRRKLRELASS